MEQDEKKSHVTTFPNARPLIKYVIFAKKNTYTSKHAPAIAGEKKEYLTLM